MRASAKAVIVRDGRLLVLTKRDGEQTFHTLPGGGQRPGETLPQALVREVREETGAEVRVGRLMHVRDYIARNHEAQADRPWLHKVELFFECHLPSNAGELRPLQPDKRQVGLAWLRLDELEERAFYPRALTPILRGERPDAPLYLGDVN